LMAGRERRSSGAYFTPHDLVRTVTDAGLERALAASCGDATASRLMSGASIDAATRAEARVALEALTVVDPACGSGAFLVHALERVADLRRLAGDGRRVADLRRDVLGRSIFGVDVNPMAVWLCELRLWLSVVIE